MPGADFADVCTDKGSDLEGDIDLGCACAIVPAGFADGCKGYRCKMLVGRLVVRTLVSTLTVDVSCLMLAL